MSNTLKRIMGPIADKEAIFSLLNNSELKAQCAIERKEIEAAIGRNYMSTGAECDHEISYIGWQGEGTQHNFALSYQSNRSDRLLSIHIALAPCRQTVFIDLERHWHSNEPPECHQFKIEIPGEIVGVNDRKYRGWFYSLERGEKDANLFPLIDLIATTIAEMESNLADQPDVNESQSPGR